MSKPPDLEALERHARTVARMLKETMPQGVGFAVVIFSLGEGGHMTYLSNARRAGMVKALKELLAHLEAD